MQNKRKLSDLCKAIPYINAIEESCQPRILAKISFKTAQIRSVANYGKTKKNNTYQNNSLPTDQSTTRNVKGQRDKYCNGENLGFIQRIEEH